VDRPTEKPLPRQEDVDTNTSLERNSNPRSQNCCWPSLYVP